MHGLLNTIYSTCAVSTLTVCCCCVSLDIFFYVKAAYVTEVFQVIIGVSLTTSSSIAMIWFIILIRHVNTREAGKDSMLCLASAHALVPLEYGTVVGAAMEKAALEALNWALIFGGTLALTHPQAAAAIKPTIRRQFLLFCTKTRDEYLRTETIGWPRFYIRQRSSRDNREIARKHPRWL